MPYSIHYREMATVHKSKPNGIGNNNNSQGIIGKDAGTIVEERKKRLARMREVLASKARFKIKGGETKVITVDAESPETRPKETVKSKSGATFELQKGVVFQIWNSVGAQQEWRLVPKHAEKLLLALEQASARYVVLAVKRERDDMATEYTFTVMGSSDEEPKGTLGENIDDSNDNDKNEDEDSNN
jgi:hypothetical protein